MLAPAAASRGNGCTAQQSPPPRPPPNRRRRRRGRCTYHPRAVGPWRSTARLPCSRRGARAHKEDRSGLRLYASTARSVVLRCCGWAVAAEPGRFEVHVAALEAAANGSSRLSLPHSTLNWSAPCARLERGDAAAAADDPPRAAALRTAAMLVAGFAPAAPLWCGAVHSGFAPPVRPPPPSPSPALLRDRHGRRRWCGKRRRQPRRDEQSQRYRRGAAICDGNGRRGIV